MHFPGEGSIPTREEATPGLWVGRLVAALPEPEPVVAERSRRLARLRPIAYPLGRAQGDELALRAGFRPLIRQLLEVGEIPTVVARFERAGYVCKVAPRVYGPTHDGWDATLHDFDETTPGARRALFIGRDRARADAAAQVELTKSLEADHEMGRLLGYPRCCVESFVTASRHRKNVEVYRAALAATRGVPRPHLNMLDLSIFHYVSFFPCSFDCELALRYADALAQILRRMHPGFATAIDDALSLHRLVVLDEIQLSLRGGLDGDRLLIDRAAPTSMFRHPDSTLAPTDEEAVVRMLSVLDGKRTLRLDGHALELDGQRFELPAEPLLVPFGA